MNQAFGLMVQSINTIDASWQLEIRDVCLRPAHFALCLSSAAASRDTHPFATEPLAMAKPRFMTFWP